MELYIYKERMNFYTDSAQLESVYELAYSFEDKFDFNIDFLSVIDPYRDMRIFPEEVPVLLEIIVNMIKFFAKLDSDISKYESDIEELYKAYVLCEYACEHGLSLLTIGD